MFRAAWQFGQRIFQKGSNARFMSTQAGGQTPPTSSASKWMIPVGLVGIAAAAPLMYSHVNKVHAQQTRAPPGDEETWKSRIGEQMSATFQNFAPVNAFRTHVTGIEVYADDPNRQLIVHKYISHINEDVMQALVFDSDKSDAKLIGVEYYITPKLFNALPEDDKKMWHTHSYEVLSGTLVAPRLPTPLEKKLMADIAPTYGKTINTWQADKYELPIGQPALMAAPTRSGMVRQSLLSERDQKLGISTEEERKSRQDIVPPTPLPGADSWEKQRERGERQRDEEQRKQREREDRERRQREDDQRERPPKFGMSS